MRMGGGGGGYTTAEQGRTLLSYSIWPWLGLLVQSGRAYITISRSTLWGGEGGTGASKRLKVGEGGERFTGIPNFKFFLND